MAKTNAAGRLGITTKLLAPVIAICIQAQSFSKPTQEEPGSQIESSQNGHTSRLQQNKEDEQDEENDRTNDTKENASQKDTDNNETGGPYIKLDTGLGLFNGSIDGGNGVMRLGYIYNSTPATIVIEIGSGLTSLAGAGHWITTSSLFAYINASPSIQPYIGIESNLADSNREGDNRYTQITAGGVFKVRDSDLSIDPLTGLASLNNGYFVRTEFKTLWSPLPNKPQHTCDGYVGWSLKRRQWLINIETGAIAFNILQPSLYMRPATKLEVSWVPTKKTEITVSLDGILWPYADQTFAASATISFVRRF